MRRRCLCILAAWTQDETFWIRWHATFTQVWFAGTALGWLCMLAGVIAFLSDDLWRSGEALAWAVGLLVLAR